MYSASYIEFTYRGHLDARRRLIEQNIFLTWTSGLARLKGWLCGHGTGAVLPVRFCGSRSLRVCVSINQSINEEIPVIS